MKAKSAKIKINSSFYKKQGILDEYVEEYVYDQLVEISKTVVNLSPVDTGSYVTSFSISTGAGRPRGKSSEGKTKGQNRQGKQQEGLDNLISDIDKLDLMSDTTLILRNGSPYAQAVEYGVSAKDGTGKTWRRAKMSSGYQVFATIRNLYG